MIWNLYVITCVAPGSDHGKQYVGITRSNPFQRFGQHFDAAKYKKSSMPLHLAMRNHGSDAFTIDHLACSRSKADALISEISIITQLQSRFPDGFNIWGRGFSLNPDHAEKIRQYNSRPEVRRQHGQDMRRYWTPQNRAAHGSKIRKRATDPTYRAKNKAQLDIARDLRRRGPGSRRHWRGSYVPDHRQTELF